MRLLRLAFALLVLAGGAAYAQSNPTLTVVVLGSGTVASSPAGISCTPDCGQSFAAGTQITLTATAATNWSFSSWQDTTCGGQGATCTLTLNQNTTVTVVFGSTATFALQDQTGLTPGTYQIYVTGYSTAGPYVLNSDGTWIAPTAPTGGATLTIPCWRFPQDINQVSINSTQTAISARVYYFIVTDTTTFPSCNPSTGNTGLFNATGAFTYTSASLNLTTPTVSQVTSLAMPSWTFSEIGTSNFVGTIDLSQVDFFTFPMNTAATVTSGNTPPNPAQIGNPLGSDNPHSVVNHASIRDSYSQYVNALAEAVNNNQNCTQDSSPFVCNYMSLLQNITTAGSAVPLYVVQNPGGYLANNPSANLVTTFDNVIAKLWSTTSAPTLVIDSGGTIGGIAEDTFTSSIVTINFPAVPALNPAYPVTAMKFTGTSTGYVAYIISPQDYANGCSSGSIPSTPTSNNYCSSPATTGYQVFAGAGTLASPVEPVAGNTFTALQTAGYISTTYTSSSDYNNLVARLGLIISAAMNRGVALVNCGTSSTTTCWQNETYWYPTQTSTTFPDITQNLFSRWMHTATIGGTPMFRRPPSHVKSASSTPGGGKAMGMAYGFAADEDPTPQVTTPPQPEVPSKLDSTVVFGVTNNTITFGPWFGAAPGPASVTLTVVNAGGGTVSSSPAGIDCEPTCSQAYPLNTQVILTAKPAKSAIFFRWIGGGCTNSHSTTCTVTLTQNTTVTAEFGEIAAAPPQEGLHVVVNGPGTVTSVPAGISCNPECSKAYSISTQITLTATPAAGSTFAGWTDACSGSGATCVVTISGAKSVGAAFVTATNHTLSVSGGVGGVVTSLPAGIDCGTRCAVGFAPGAVVGLVAHPQAGYRFAGWTGACSGTQTCDVAMDSSKSVQAMFTAIGPGQYSLTVHDFGQGSIVSSPPGISCGTSCSAAFSSGTEVSLFALPAPGHQFAGWSGACTGLGACVVFMDDVANVDALFTPSAVPPPGPLTSEPIPTLSEWALMLLCLLMLAMGYRQLRTKHARAGSGGRGERI